ncbi:MAG: hypothetical protein CSA33_01235 [Desulfobulbus propionicus]|nr:MAG: hypothetical protein CSA33_01235 [Desulfobulbus propionicus]
MTDQRLGGAWKDFLKPDPSRASDNCGRGIAMAKMIVFDLPLYNKQGHQVTAFIKRPKKKTSAQYDCPKNKR